MEFPEANESQIAAYFSFHDSSWVRSGEPGIQKDERASNMTPTAPEKQLGQRGVNEERKLSVHCFLLALLSDTQLEEAELLFCLRQPTLL